MSNERAAFKAEVAQVEQWWKVQSIISLHQAVSSHIFLPQSPRFARVKRPYTAEQVVSKRGSVPIFYPSDALAKKLWGIFSQHAQNKTPSHTYGA